MKTINERDLPYALAILDGFDKPSLSNGELLSKYSPEIVTWLHDKDLLVFFDLVVEGKKIERRVALGMRALNLRSSGYEKRLKILKDINNGQG